MMSIRDKITETRIVIALGALLVLAVIGLVVLVVCQDRQTDTTPEKLDTVETQPTIKKEDVMTNRYRWQCELVKVIDGDTLEAEIHLDFGVKLQAKLRIGKIDTPEIHTAKHNTEEYRKGILAKEFVEERFKVQGKKFWIETTGNRKGKYGRFIVDVLLPSGDYLGELLVKAGHAVRKEY